MGKKRNEPTVTSKRRHESRMKIDERTRAAGVGFMGKLSIVRILYETEIPVVGRCLDVILERS